MQDSTICQTQLLLKWAILEKALHKQCGQMHMDTKIGIIKMVIIMLN
jgi:hypothetical protein